eukprot:TRINITY_DN20229_c0_g1_i2.p1 TRINITY_DN20229_c0_g1~~TRINITY_DN20229_c0_g1_i2.p1  ORF type:complete len:271 (-),score=57.89 TRINITY_DN20229_c0_g1_i2:104-916(-)
MIRRPPRSTLSSSSAASDVYKRQVTIPPDSNVPPPRWSTHLQGRSLVDQDLQVLGQVHELQQLQVRRCWRLTDHTLATLGAHCPKLISLSLGTEKLTDAGIASLTEGCPRLCELDLTRCKQLTDDALISLGANCAELTDVHLGCCDRITDRGIERLARGCPQLSRLDLSCCKKITDQSIQSLAQHCTKLTDVRLGWCTAITEQAVGCLVARCPELNYIDLPWCKGIRGAGPRTAWVSEEQRVILDTVLVRDERSRALGYEHLWANTNLAY